MLSTRKIRGYGVLKKVGNEWTILLRAKKQILEMIVEYMVRGRDLSAIKLDIDFMIHKEEGHQDDKSAMMGYYRAEVLQKGLYGFNQLGEELMTEPDAHYNLKLMFFNKSTYIYERDRYEIRVRSLSEASYHELRDFIDKSIKFIETELRTKVQDPEEYKNNRNKLTEL